jgi:cytidyltransferase-like protein
MRTRGYCALTADILHSGHIKFLNKCKELCDHLTVGVMADECVKEYKGKKPIMPLEDRIKIVSSLKMVDDVIIQKQFEYPDNLRMKEGIDIIIDSITHQRTGADVYIKYDKTISSTKIKERIIESSRN